MIRSRLILSTLLTLLLASVVIFGGLGGDRSTATSTQPAHYTDLTFPDPPPITIPDSETFELDNGMRVYLMEDHELPLVTGIALFRTGARWEPADQVGFAQITGSLLRSGGTQHDSPEELNQTLEDRAASIEAGIGTTSGSVQFNVLTPDLTPIFAIFAEVIREPRFDPQQLELLKTQWQGQIARRNDNPQSIASREFGQLLYGADSPYARVPEYTTIAAIDQQSVKDFYNLAFQPDGLLLGIVGDFQPAAMRALIEAELGDWQAPKPQPSDPTRHANRELEPELRDPEPAHQGGIFLIDQPQLTQSSVRIGHLGGRIDSPDFPALQVMNEVLNGFGGRLFNTIRSQQGLAYGVYASWSPEFDYPGIFIAGGETRSEATVPFIEAIRTEIQRIRTEPITAAELQDAKDSVLNAFVFNFQDPSQTLLRLLRYEYYDYPEDLIFRYRDGVEATQIEDVQRVASTYLKPQDLVTLVVGNATSIQPPLTELDPNVEEVDISIPAPPEA